METEQLHSWGALKLYGYPPTLDQRARVLTTTSGYFLVALIMPAIQRPNKSVSDL